MGGVPKIEKRPNTTPTSPLLGLRRTKGGSTTSKLLEKSKRSPGKGSKVIKESAGNSGYSKKRLSDTVETKTSNYLDKSKGNKEKSSIMLDVNSMRLKPGRKETSVGTSTLFKARPIPSSNNMRYHAGQIGIPKVSKRAVTVPISPSLGPKRQSEKFVKQAKRSSTDNSKRKSIIKTTSSRWSAGLSVSTQIKTSVSPSSVTSSVKSAELLGLNLVDSRLDSTPEDKNFIKNEINDDNNNVTPTNSASSILPFEPRSTTRATMRKKYDVRRDENREMKLQEEREELKLRIKMIHRELIILSKKI